MATKNNTIDNMVKLRRRQRQINESTQSTSKFKPNSTTSWKFQKRNKSIR